MSFTILLSLFVFVSLSLSTAQNQAPPFQQVPVCTQISSNVPEGGSFHGLRGEQGRDGKRGPRGEMGIKGEKGSDGTKGEKCVKGVAGKKLKNLDCPTIKYHFPRDNQIEDYARYRTYVPRMKEGTICLWVETQDHEAALTPFVSYATSENNNERLVFLHRSEISLYATDRRRINFGISYTSILQLEVHICVWFSSRRQQSGLFINGEVSATKNLSINVMAGGGDLVLAQEQDAVNAGSLEASQAFRGNITNPMIWPRVLSPAEIRNIATSCQCPQDYAVAMTVDKTEVYGEAYYSIPDECPTL